MLHEFTYQKQLRTFTDALFTYNDQYTRYAKSWCLTESDSIAENGQILLQNRVYKIKENRITPTNLIYGLGRSTAL